MMQRGSAIARRLQRLRSSPSAKKTFAADLKKALRRRRERMTASRGVARRAPRASKSCETKSVDTRAAIRSGETQHVCEHVRLAQDSLTRSAEGGATCNSAEETKDILFDGVWDYLRGRMNTGIPRLDDDMAPCMHGVEMD